MSINQHKKSIYTIIKRILAGIGILASILGIYDFFWKADIIFESGKRPNIITESKPYVTPYLQYKTPEFAGVLEKYVGKEDSTNGSESIIFDIYDKPKPEILKLIEIGKLNWDSINYKDKNPKITEVLPTFIFTIDFKNVGDFGADVALVTICDIVSFEPVLRYDIKEKIDKSERFESWEDAIIGYEEHKGSILTDSVYKMKRKYTLQNINDDFFCVLHVNILYRDKKGKYYDSYVWIKYKFKEYQMRVSFEPHYTTTDGKKFVLSKLITHYKPRKPKIEDVLDFIEMRHDYEYEYTKEQNETLDYILGKKE